MHPNFFLSDYTEITLHQCSESWIYSYHIFFTIRIFVIGAFKALNLMQYQVLDILKIYMLF